MRKALYILGQLIDSDVEWLARHGKRQALADGETLVRAGAPIDALYITLSGQLGVTLSHGEEVARLLAGEVVGEISFVDASSPAATVTAADDAVVLSLAKPILRHRLSADPAFAARFYRALAIFLADRLRATTYRLDYGAAGDLNSDAVLADELDASVLDNVSQAGERFARLLRTLAQEHTG